MCERVGQDLGCGHEESHFMHDMIYSIYDCIFCIECGMMRVSLHVHLGGE